MARPSYSLGSIRSKFARLAQLVIPVFALTSCASVPVADSSWVAANCSAMPPVALDLQGITGCTPQGAMQFQCNYTNGDSYTGTLLSGRPHGLGRYTFANGAEFVGQIKSGQQWCGIEDAEGAAFFVWKDGVATQAQAGVDWAAVAVGVLLVGIVAAAAAGGGGGGSSYVPPATDYDWDWDGFYNQFSELVWACRGIQTGQFADASNCTYDLKTDVRWPDK